MASDADTGSEKREHYVIEPVRRVDTDTGLVERLRSLLIARREAKSEAAADVFTHEIGLLVAGAPETILAVLSRPSADFAAVVEQCARVADGQSVHGIGQIAIRETIAAAIRSIHAPLARC